MFWILWFVLKGSRCRSRDVRTFVGGLTLRPISPPSPGAFLLYLSCARQLSSLRSVLLPLASRLKPPPPPFPGLIGYKFRWGAALCYLHRARRASLGACAPVQSSGFPPRVAVSRNRDLAFEASLDVSPPSPFGVPCAHWATDGRRCSRRGVRFSVSVAGVRTFVGIRTLRP